MSLAFDTCRCQAAKTTDGNIVEQCQTCRRYVERYPAGERSPWFVFPPLELDDECDSYLPTE